MSNVFDKISAWICAKLGGRCRKCFWKKAVWFYGPANEKLSGYDLCDDCVPRGCDCNHCYSKDLTEFSELPPPVEEMNKTWKWIDEEKGIWTPIDEKGREYPCCEWFKDE